MIPEGIRPTVMVRHSPRSFLVGVVLALFLLLFYRPMGDISDTVRDWLWPVAKAWRVTHATVLGDDLILRGWMVKQRECLHLPPNLARDDFGNNYTVLSKSPTIGISYPPSQIPFRWGPWTIRNGANKRLDLFATYQCGPNGRHSIVKLGSFNPVTWKALPDDELGEVLPSN